MRRIPTHHFQCAASTKPKIIELPFGKKGLDEYISRAREREVPANELILEDLKEMMREMGYSEDAINRAIFEDALDYQVYSAVRKVRELIRHGKVPKVLRFEITVPKRE